jgi:hypothetical protein
MNSSTASSLGRATWRACTEAVSSHPISRARTPHVLLNAGPMSARGGGRRKARHACGRACTLGPRQAALHTTMPHTTCEAARLGHFTS